jgi:glutathionyl-hydroquinone reductase
VQRFSEIYFVKRIPAVTVVSPRLDDKGWPFAKVDKYPGADEDPLYGSSYVKDLYLKADPGYEGRFTVPILWDKKNQTVANNESSEIIRIFNKAFNHLIPEDKAALDLYPTELRLEIDSINEWVYDTINSELASNPPLFMI